jgi:hypothetical protein
VELVEQRPGVFQADGVEALGEPVVDFSKHRARLVATISIAQEPCQAHRRTQLPPFGATSSGYLKSLAKKLLALGPAGRIAQHFDLAAKPTFGNIIASFLSKIFALSLSKITAGPTAEG